MPLAVLSVLLLHTLSWFGIFTLLLQKTVVVFFVSKQGKGNDLPYILGTCSVFVVVVT